MGGGEREHATISIAYLLYASYFEIDGNRISNTFYRNKYVTGNTPSIFILFDMYVAQIGLACLEIPPAKLTGHE